MKTGFIIAEFNPFHNGHRRLIEKTRENGADAVCIIMSGNFVQRGAPAVAEKHLRARHALENGADLVLELPLKYALSSADKFASGGVKTAAATGLDGFLSFGAPAGADVLERLFEIRQGVSGSDISALVTGRGYSYPRALAEAMRLSYPGEDYTDKMNDANNILALEYMAASREAGLCTVPVKRTGAMHGDLLTDGGIASSTAIREIMSRGGDISPFVPVGVAGTVNEVNERLFSSVFGSLLAGKTAEDLILSDNVNDGLENRIASAVRSASGFYEIASEVKTKRYTMAKIKRILLSAALGITAEDCAAGAGYIRVLGANGRGREMLREMKEKASLPVISNLSEVKNENKKALRDAELDYLAGKLFNYCLDFPAPGNPEYGCVPVFIP